MDELDVAVAAVIVALLSGLSGIVLAAWSTKRNEKMTRESLIVNERLTRDTLAANERLARENRVEDKRADSYLEILRMVEREGQALSSILTRLEARTEPDYGQPQPRTTERPPLSDRAGIDALLAAFGSRKLTARVESWSTAVEQFDEEYARLAFDWGQNAGDPNEPLDWDSLEELRGFMRNEQSERQEVARQVASELTSVETGQA